jgi:hypothetical protein
MNRRTAISCAAKRLTNWPAHGFSAVFRTMARLRQASAVHPRGVTFTARLIVCHKTPMVPQGNYPATVRLSKGAGTPGRWPDVLGLALRFHLLNRADPCDVLFSSARDGRWTRWLPLPAADWGGTRYGTLAPYESAGRWWWLMLTPSGPLGHASIHELEYSPPPNFTLHISGETGPWHQVGRLDLHGRLDNTRLVFDPVLNHPHGASPAPRWLRQLRERAYSASRQGHHAPSPGGDVVVPPASARRARAPRAARPSRDDHRER